ncbi:MAG: DUF3040 domain-containing protein [Acidimicrobiales bacterium]
MGTQDRVRLSVQERKELATIEAMVQAGDPELAKALSGPMRPWEKAWRRLLLPVALACEAVVTRAAPMAARAIGRSCLRTAKRLPTGLKRTCLEERWPGPVLVVLGLGVVFVTISNATWLSVLGLLVITAGLVMWLFTWRRPVGPKPAC